MPVIRLKSENNIFTGTGSDMRYNKPKHEYPMHDHEFHEIVLVSRGDANHYINGRVLPMTTGELYFIRNTDVHTYSDFVGETFEYYVLLYETDIVKEMFSYFGFEEKDLFSAELPPKVHLNEAEREALSLRFFELFMLMHDDIPKYRTCSRMLLADVFSDYFLCGDRLSENLPLWLEYACEKMRQPKNFAKGTERFFEICGRKREHCTRTMKKYMGMTPAGYILDLRMKYAASLLASGDMTVGEAAAECGYNSLPHFYELFSKAYGISPGEYRKKYNKVL